MIFSFSQNSKKIEIPLSKDTDTFCFFDVRESVKCPSETWVLSLLASLRLKKNVLLLEESCVSFPLVQTSKRWAMGEGWLWISPRAFNEISANYKIVSTDIVSLKTFLNNSN